MIEREFVDETGSPQKSRRRRTPYDYFVASGSVAGAILSVVAVAGAALAGVRGIPEVFGLARASELADLRRDFDGFALAQQETLELSLIARVQEIDDQIALVGGDTQRLQSLRASRNELQQRLDKARTAINRLSEPD